MTDTFANVIAFSILGLLLVVGTILRANVPLLRNGLVPAALVGGIVGFTSFAIVDVPAVTDLNFAGFTFHFFTLSFISLALTQGGSATERGPGLAQGSTWLSSIWIFSLVIQAAIGLAVIAIYNYLTNGDTSPFLGIIATHGFTQGPGQALAMASIWEQNFGVHNVVSVGLIYATLGFIVSFVVGVPVARWSIRKGLTANKSATLNEEFSRGLFSHASTVSTGRQITHPANVDTLAWHLSILGLVYLITHAWLLLLGSWIDGVHVFGVGIDLIASHNLFFAHGLIIALVARRLMNRVGWGRFIDNDTQKRITGTSVDFMMVALLLSIQISTLLELLVPILMITILITLVTSFMCFGLGRQLANFQVERALTSFGTCTGSAGSALLLLRIVDPDFSTPVSKELAIFNVTVTLGTFHIWAFFAPMLPSLSALLAVGVYLGTFIVVGLVFLQLKIRKVQKEA